MAANYKDSIELLEYLQKQRALRPEEPAPAPAAKSEQGMFGDLVDYAQRAFLRGFADDAELVSLASDAAGVKMGSDLFEGASDKIRARSDAAASTLSTDALESQKLEFIHEDKDGKYSFGDAWFDKDAWIRLAGEGIGSLASIVATGGPIGGIIKYGAKKVGGKVLRDKLKDAVEKDAKELMAKGLTEAEAKKEVAKRVAALDAVAAKKLEAIDKLSNAAGYGLATGAQVGGSTANGLQQMVENTSFEKLNNSPAYQETFWDIKDANPNLSDDQVHEQARKSLARELSKPAAAMGFAIGAVSGPVLGKYIDDVLAGKVAGSLTKRIAMGAGVEGGTEFFEEGAQQAAQNLAFQQVDPTQRVMQGVLPAAVEGGLGGAMAGGPTGLMSGRNVEKDIEAGMTPEQRLKTGVASKRLGVEIDQVLAEGEAALEQQRSEVTNLLSGIRDAARGLMAQKQDLANIPFEQSVPATPKAKKAGPAATDVNVYDSFARQQPTGFEPFFKPDMQPQPPSAAEQAAALVPEAHGVGVAAALEEVNRVVASETPVSSKEMDDIVAGIKAKRPKPPKKETSPKPKLPEAPAAGAAVEGLASAAPVAVGAQAPSTAGAVVTPKKATKASAEPSVEEGVIVGSPYHKAMLTYRNMTPEQQQEVVQQAQKSSAPERVKNDGVLDYSPGKNMRFPKVLGNIILQREADQKKGAQQPATTQAPAAQPSATQQPEAQTTLAAAPDAQEPIGTTMTPEEIDAAANEAATSPQNDLPEPTEAQKESGQYEKGHVIVQGMNIAIENPAGSKRRPEWPALKNHYGYVKRSEGADGDPVDVFVGPTPESKTVFVVDQVKEDGSFDEHKAMVGFNTIKEARDAYNSNYSKGWTGLGAITAMPAPQFKAWLKGGSKKPVNRAVPLSVGAGATETVTGAAPVAPGVETAAAPKGAQAASQSTTPTDLKTAFRMYNKEGGKRSIAATQQLVNSISAGWAVKPSGFNTIASFDEAPESARNAHRKRQEAGVTENPVAFLHEASPGRYEVYVVNDALPDNPSEAAMEIAKSMYHEGVGHFGMRKMFGPRMDRVLAEAGRLYKDKLNAKAKQYGFDLTDSKQRSKAMDEVVAELMEDPANRQLPIVRRALSAIRETLRPIVKAITGYDLQLTDDEIIRDFVMPARDLVLTGKASTMADRRRVLSKYGAAKGPAREVVQAVAPRESAFKEADTSPKLKDDADKATFKLAEKMEAKPKRREKSGVEMTPSGKRYISDQQTREENFLRWFGDSVTVDEPREDDTKDILAEIQAAEGDSDAALEFAEKYKDEIMDAQGVPGANREETWEVQYSEQDKIDSIADFENVLKARKPGRVGQKVKGGFAQIWLHGTSVNFPVFRKKVADAIFVTRGSNFAHAFALRALNNIVNNFDAYVTPEQRDEYRVAAVKDLDAFLDKRFGETDAQETVTERTAKMLGYKVIEEDGEQLFLMENDPDTPPMTIDDMPVEDEVELRQAMMEDEAIAQDPDKSERSRIRKQQIELIMSNDPKQNLASAFFAQQLTQHTMEGTLPNIPGSDGPMTIPVYVKAENPFDYENEQHRAGLEKWLRERGSAPIIDVNNQEFDVNAAMASVRDGRWQMIEGVTIQEAIKDIGHDGFFVEEDLPGLTGNVAEKNLAVYSPNQLKSAVGNTGFYSESDPDFVARLPGHRASWDAPEPTGFDNFIYLLQDKQVDTKRIIDSIKAAGGKVADAANTYIKETLYHGRTAKRVEEFWTGEFQPLLADIHSRGKTVVGFEEYLLARQAAETNAVLRERNPYTAEPKNGWSGMSDSQAADYFKKLSATDKRAYEELAKKVDAITEQTRQTLVDYGLETQETIDGWKATFKNYVPLHREDMGDNMVIGQGFSVRGPSTKSRTGSDKKVVNILANIAQQRDQAIIRGEKNIVANSLVELARENPNETFWRVDDPPTIKYRDNAGIVRTMVDPNYRGRRNVITARFVETDKKGNKVIREHSVVFNEQDDRALRMSESLKNLDADEMSELMTRWAKVTRYFASVNTQYNPVFGVINLVRDVQSGIFNLSSTPLRGQQWKVVKMVPSALRGIMSDLRAIRQGRPASSQWAHEFEEFQREGGQTGYRDLFVTATERDAKQIADEFKKMQREGTEASPLQALKRLGHNPAGAAEGLARWTFNLLSDYNAAMENAMRLAAYKAAKEMKISKAGAANIAKNLTVNFNRKGQMGRQIGVAYAFFNASTQGTARLAQTLFKPTTDGSYQGLSDAGKKIVMGGLLVGVAQAIVLAAYFDEDEPPEFVRQRNLIIPLKEVSGKKDYIAIPMPLSLHVIPNIARMATASLLSGFKETPERIIEGIGLILDAFNPIGNAGLSFQTLSPTATDPLVALTENRDWTGKPITAPDYTPLKSEPGFMRTKDTATWYSKMLSEVVNYIGGGSEYSAGVLTFTPDQFDYLFEQLTGGVGRELSKANQLVESAATGEELPTHKIPLLGRLYGSAEGQSSQAGKFYANLKRAYKHDLELAGRRSAGIDVGPYLKENPEAKLWSLAAKSQQRVQELRRRKRFLIEKGADKERIRTMENLITDVMRNFNDRFTAAREGTE